MALNFIYLLLLVQTEFGQVSKFLCTFFGKFVINFHQLLSVRKACMF